MSQGDAGERAFLRRIRNLVHTARGGVLGFDEDASDIPLAGSEHVVINVDTFVREFDWLKGMTPAQAGRKTAVMTISDVLVKGATPRAMMLSLSFPKDYPREDAHEMVRGFSQYCLKNGISFIGGDTGSSCDVVLTGVGIGLAPVDGIVTRGGANAGDIIAVTANFGYTALAFEHLLHNLALPPSIMSDALAAAYNPHLQYDIIKALAEKQVLSSAMDSSDGLGITLHTMAELSGHAFEVHSLPISSEVIEFAEASNLSPFNLVMYGGEEFIPVITIPPSRIEIANEIAAAHHVKLIEIGVVKSGVGVRYRSENGYIEVRNTGYDSLKGWG